MTPSTSTIPVLGQMRRWIAWIGLSAWVGFAVAIGSPLLTSGGVSAQSPARALAASPSQTTGAKLQISTEMGLGKQWKVGYSTRMRISVKGGEKGVTGWVQVRTVDGDGVPVLYKSKDWQVHFDPDQPASLEVYAQHGRSNQPIYIRLVDADHQLIIEQEVSLEERGSPLPSTQPWILSIAGDMGFDQASVKTIDGSLASFSSAIVSRCEDLPRSAVGYEGADQLALSTLNVEDLSNMSPEQSQAIREWVERGGKLLVSVGKSAKRVSGMEWLQGMLPTPIIDSVSNVDPGPLESWLNSEKPLDRLTCAQTQNASLVELNVMNARRESFPLISKRAVGLGQVTLFAADIDGPSITAWSDRNKFLEKLLLGTWKQSGKSTRTKESIASVGYDDLSGQMRATLDLFSNVETANLTLLAAVLGLFLLVVGPLDYFVVSRSWKKPKWTWWTLAISSLGASIGIGALAVHWKPKGVQVNQLSIWDLDLSTRQIHGRMWAHLYSGDQHRFEVKGTTKPVGLFSKDSQSIDLDWLGLPGNGLGGFESSVASDRGMPEYGIDTTAGPSADSTIQEVGIPLAGTKAFQGSWTRDWDVPNTRSELHLVSGSDLLQGSWENPLGVDILDGAIYYRNWLYVLPSRFAPNQSLELSVTSLPKDLTRRLQRKRMVDGVERNLAWDPMERKDLGRIAETMMFYKAAGGENYTSLGNRFLKNVDHSELLRMDRAIIVGRIKEESTQLVAKRGTVEQPVSMEKSQTWIRILIPVSP